jgi:hypothetical protein
MEAVRLAHGESLAQQMIGAELARVGPNVDPAQIRDVAEGLMPEAVATYGETPEAAQAAVEAAATAVAGGRWQAGHPGHMGENIARYYAARAKTIQAVDRGMPSVAPPSAPGTYLTPQQLAAKHGRKG